MSKMKNTRTMLLFLLVTMISLGVSAQNVTVKGTVKPAMVQSPTLTVITL